jgi:hypothetical protein
MCYSPDRAHARAKHSEREKLEFDARRVLQEAAVIAFYDPRQAFDERGSLKPLHEIPEHVARAISSVEILEEYEWEDGKKVFKGYTKIPLRP